MLLIIYLTTSLNTHSLKNSPHYTIHAPYIDIPKILVQYVLHLTGISFSLHSIQFFPLLLVIMKPLILVYCYYDESHNVLDTMEGFPNDNEKILGEMGV